MRPFDVWMMVIAAASLAATIAIAVIVALANARSVARDRQFRAMDFALGRLDVLDVTLIDEKDPEIDFLEQTQHIRLGIESLLGRPDKALSRLLNAEFDYAQANRLGSPMKRLRTQIQGDIARDATSYIGNRNYRQGLKKYSAERAKERLVALDWIDHFNKKVGRS